MKKVLAVVLLCLAVLFCVRHARAEVKTLSWNPVSTYTDGSPVETARFPITYDAWWSTSNTFVTPHNLLSSGTATSVQFDVVAQGMVRGTTIYFGARARIANPVEVSADSPPFAWTVPNIVLVSIAINGPTSVNENGTGTYTATATWSDNSTTTITPTWSEDSTYTTISAGGVLTASAVTSNQMVTVTASYTSGGVTKTDTQSVSIQNVPQPLAAPTGINITD